MSKKKAFHPCLSKWRARIDAAEKRGCFNWRDQRAAGNWRLCADGEARQRYPQIVEVARPMSSCPSDRRLVDLGCEFAEVVVRENGRAFKIAGRIIGQIEKRLIQLDKERHAQAG